MRHWLREPRKRALLGLTLLGVIAVGLLAPFVFGGDARHLSAYADDREDLSAFRAQLQGSTEAILGSPAMLLDVDDPTKALYIAIGPERRYDDAESDAIIRFLREGGRVLIADERGYSARIAREAGLTVDGNLVLDSGGYRGDVRFPVVDASVTEGGSTYRVVFNLPSKITELSSVGAYGTLARSTASRGLNGSFVDKNDNLVIETSDEPGPHVLAARAVVGQGELVLVADTGLFMNEQLRVADSQYQNEAYVRALVSSLLPTGGTIFLDESRHAPPAPIAAWNNGVRTLARLTTGLAAPIFLLGLAVLTFVAWLYTRETEDWSHHHFDLGHKVPAPEDVRPDSGRLQRMARRRISERYNIPLEQVAAMPAEELLRVTGDRSLSEAAAGTLRGDPGQLFASLAPAPVSSSPEVS